MDGQRQVGVFVLCRLGWLLIRQLGLLAGHWRGNLAVLEKEVWRGVMGSRRPESWIGVFSCIDSRRWDHGEWLQNNFF